MASTGFVPGYLGLTEVENEVFSRDFGLICSGLRC